MSAGSGPRPEQRSTEQRAEELVQRITHDASRWLGRVVGRAREELEDLVAEARSLNERGTRADGDEDSGGTPPPRAHT